MNFASGAGAESSFSGQSNIPVFSMWEENDINLNPSPRDKTLTESGVKFTKEYYMKAYSFVEEDLELAEPGVLTHSKVLVENRDFKKLINQYDHAGAFFYCDPPYTFGCGYETTSTKDFDHERLRNKLGNIEGRFLLSYDDSEKIRELYKGYEMIAVERLNGINNKDRKNKI